VYVRSEALTLAEEPIETPIGPRLPEPVVEGPPDDNQMLAEGQPSEPANSEPGDKTAAIEIELDGVYGGLEAGRWLLVSGERMDIPGAIASELVMLASSRQDVKMIEVPAAVGGNDANGAAGDNGDVGLIELPGDKVHTFLQLDAPLTFTYKRDTVKIYANVV